MEIEVLNCQFKLTSALKLKEKILIKKCTYNLLISYEARCYAVYKTLKSLKYEFFFNAYKNPKTNKHYKRLVDKLGHIILDPKSYKLDPLKQISLDNLEKKKKIFYVSRFLDLALQKLYSFVLFPFMEVESDKFSYGGKFLRQPADLAKVVLLLCKGKFSTNTVFSFSLTFNIIGCFDQIFNDWVVCNVPVIPKFILFEWLRFGLAKFNNFYNCFQSVENDFVMISQNVGISALICNFVLNGLQLFVEGFIKNNFPNNERCILFRFLNNVIVLCSTIGIAKLAKNSLEEFVKIRGLYLNITHNYTVNLFCKNHNLIFMGVRFRYFLLHGKYKFKVSISSCKLIAIKKKVSLICKKSKNPQTLIKSVNFLMRECSSFYNICNSKFFFIKLSYWLVKKVSKALYLLYIKSSFEKGRFAIRKGRRSGRLRRKIAAQVVKRLHFLNSRYRFLYGFNKQKNRLKRFSIVLSKNASKVVELFLPNYIEHKKHFVTYNKNYFTFFDYNDLRILAFQKKSSFREYFLKISKGFCPLCLRDLINSRYKFHCIKPFSLDERKNFLNFVPLCVCCYNFLIINIRNNNINYIKKFMNLALLKLD